MGEQVYMLDMNNLQLSDLGTKLSPINDKHLSGLKHSWYEKSQKPVSHQEFVDLSLIHI